MDSSPTVFYDASDVSRRIRPHNITVPAMFFDGAAANDTTGCGAWIKISDMERFHIHWNGGPGSNNKVEVMALWGGLFIAYDLQLQIAGIYGDSKLVIGWLSGETHMVSPLLQGWLDRTRKLWNQLGSPPLQHIYRELNTRADRLSKKGLMEDFGILKVAHFIRGSMIDIQDIPLP